MGGRIYMIIICDAGVSLARAKRYMSSCEELNELVIEDWVVYVSKTLYARMYEQLRNVDVLKEAITIVNSHIEELGENCPDIVWFVYQDIVRAIASSIAIHRIIDATNVIGVGSETVILCGDIRRFRAVNSCSEFHGRVVQAKPSLERYASRFTSELKRFCYAAARVFVSIPRLARSKLMGGECDLVTVKNDQFVRHSTGFGDPNIDPVVDYVHSASFRIASLSYPSLEPPTMRNLWEFLGTKEADIFVAYEAFYAVTAVRRLLCPRAFRKRVEEALRSLYSFVERWPLVQTHDFRAIIHRVVLSEDSARRALRVLSPKNIVLTGEYSKGLKTLVSVARSAGIRVFALQHGVIYRNHPGYAFPAKILSNHKPSVFLTHGEVYSEILRCAGYEQDSEIITLGHPQLGAVSRSLSMFNERSEESDKCVLVTSQPGSRYALRRALTRDVPAHIEAYLRQNVHCIIRPHPKHERDIAFYRQVEDRYPFKSLTFDQFGDLQKLLQRADIQVSFTSTCIQEGLALGLPVIEVIELPQSYSFGSEFGGRIPFSFGASTTPEHLLETLYETLAEYDARPFFSQEEVFELKRLFASTFRPDIIVELIGYAEDQEANLL